MSQIRPPIVIIEGHDVSLHKSVEAVAHFLEPPDVAKGVYEIFDAEGRLLRATTNGRVVQIEASPEGTQHRERLVRSLREFLGRVDVSTRADAELADLVEASVNAGLLYDPPPSMLAFLKNWLGGLASRRGK